MKVCFILSGVGGPRMLASLFSGHVKEDVVYLVIQRMAGEGLLEVLVECLREELNRKTVIALQPMALQPGTIHFLSNDRNYGFDGDKLALAEVPGRGGLSLDHLFHAAAALSRPCAVVALSGLLTDNDGLAGLARLRAAGASVLGSLESHTPVFDMIEQLQKHGLMGELYPPKYLLEHVLFQDHSQNGKGKEERSPGQLKFLVADDEPGIRSMIGDMLSHHGAACEFAVDGLDALRKIQKGKFDGLILDLQMPEMDGLKTLEALKTIDPKLPIVVLTGLDDPAKIQAARDFNVLGVLQKPFTWDKLKKILPRLGKDAAGD